ncbi:MAG: hypothetical protein AAGM46_25515 [Cyanobacteria bacterium J06582_2]
MPLIRLVREISNSPRKFNRIHASDLIQEVANAIAKREFVL